MIWQRKLENKWLEQIEQGLMLKAQREMGFKQLTDAVSMHMETTDEFIIETNIEEDTMWVTLDHREMPLLRIQLQVNNSNEILLTCNVCQEEMDPLTMNFILEGMISTDEECTSIETKIIDLIWTELN